MSQQSSQLSSFMCIVLLLLASSFYIYEFMIRTSTGIIGAELMQHFGIDGAILSIISSGFFYGYAPLQVPAGLLIDHYGPHRSLVLGMLLCSLGVLSLGLSTHAYWAFASRWIQGASACVAYLGPMVLSSQWFASKRFTTVVGCIQTLGCCGALLGQIPVAKLNQVYSWQMTVFMMSAMGMIMTLIMHASLKNTSKPCYGSNQKIHAFDTIISLLKKPQTLRIALLGFFSWGPMTIFAELWGIGYLESITPSNHIQAASMLSWVWIGVAIGSPIWGYISNQLQRRCLPLMLALLLGLFCIISLLYIPFHQIFLTHLQMFILGLACSAQCIGFGLVHDHHAKENLGCALGIQNMGVIAGGIILQPLVGFLLRWHHLDQTLKAHVIYTKPDFLFALSIMPMCFICALIVVLLFIDETHCKPRHQSLESS